MAEFLVGILGLVGFLLLAFFGLPLGFSFALSGFIGMVFLRGIAPALDLIGGSAYAQTASFVLCALPLFVLMGQLTYYSGISRDLFEASYKWMSKLPGGLAIATMGACTAFAACTGSSVASAATMSTICFPEMKKYNYNPRLATGTIAAGGTLGILIPPSTIFIIIGILTETNIGALFIAGILPGLITSALFTLLIWIMCTRNPFLGPPGEAFSWREKLHALKGVWGLIGLFVLVIGGLYIGIFSPSEAGSIGAAGAFVLAIIKGTSPSNIIRALKESAQITSYMLLILIGASIFNTFLGVAGLPAMVNNWIGRLHLPPIGIVICILLLYIPLGMFLDTLGMILLTLPIFFPIIIQLGFDPVWFGVLVCMMAELGMITPPVAINIYVVRGVTKVSMVDIAYGVLPFIVVFLIAVGLIVAFPEIALFLPSTMK